MNSYNIPSDILTTIVKNTLLKLLHKSSKTKNSYADAIIDAVKNVMIPESEYDENVNPDDVNILGVYPFKNSTHTFMINNDDIDIMISNLGTYSLDDISSDDEEEDNENSDILFDKDEEEHERLESIAIEEHYNHLFNDDLNVAISYWFEYTDDELDMLNCLLMYRDACYNETYQDNEKYNYD